MWAGDVVRSGKSADGAAVDRLRGGTPNRPALLRTAFLLTRDWGKAEDLLQTALAKAYPRWKQIEDGPAP